MGLEQQIEDQVTSNLAWFGYEGARRIWRAKLGRKGFGAVDLVLLPDRGPHRVVLVEVKHAASKDTPGRLVGQLLAYYLASLRLSSEGVDCLRTFADRPEAHSTGSKSLQMLSGLGRGSKHKDLERLRSGQRLTSAEVAMLIVIGTESLESRESLEELRNWIGDKARVDVPVAIAHADRSFEWAGRPRLAFLADAP